jgi:hypothetical protein
MPNVFVSTIPASAAAGEARSRKKQQILCAVVSSYLPEYSEDPILHAELKALTEPHTTGPGKLSTLNVAQGSSGMPHGFIVDSTFDAAGVKELYRWVCFAI